MSVNRSTSIVSAYFTAAVNKCCHWQHNMSKIKIIIYIYEITYVMIYLILYLYAIKTYLNDESRRQNRSATLVIICDTRGQSKASTIVATWRMRWSGWLRIRFICWWLILRSSMCPDPTTAIRCEKIMPRACNVSQKTGHS